jgi:hypothetical protein
MPGLVGRSTRGQGTEDEHAELQSQARTIPLCDIDTACYQGCLPCCNLISVSNRGGLAENEWQGRHALASFVISAPGWRAST